MKKVFLDTETTGLAPGSIAQLSMIIEYDDGKVEAKNYFFEIDYITQGAEEACGRGIDFYKQASGGKRFEEYKDEILNIVSDATLIAHNEQFDENFISTEFWRLGIQFRPSGRFCTMEHFKPILKLPGKGTYKYKNPKLEEVLDAYSVDKTKVKKYSDDIFNSPEDTYGFHDARFDTTAMFVVFQIYKEGLINKRDWANTFCICN